MSNPHQAPDRSETQVNIETEAGMIGDSPAKRPRHRLGLSPEVLQAAARVWEARLSGKARENPEGPPASR